MRFSGESLFGAVLAFLLAASPGGLSAEPLPLPRVDFLAEARVRGLETPVLLRHHAGLFRIDGRHQGQEMTLLIDARAGKATLVSDLGGQKLAVPFTGAEAALLRGETLEGRRIGSDRVAGQPCDLWSVEERQSGRSGILCLSADGIPLRLTPAGGERTDFEVLSLERVRQDPALFRLP